jgi:hypothetical protein
MDRKFDIGVNLTAFGGAFDRINRIYKMIDRIILKTKKPLPYGQGSLIQYKFLSDQV